MNNYSDYLVYDKKTHSYQALAPYTINHQVSVTAFLDYLGWRDKDEIPLKWKIQANLFTDFNALNKGSEIHSLIEKQFLEWKINDKNLDFKEYQWIYEGLVDELNLVKAYNKIKQLFNPFNYLIQTEIPVKSALISEITLECLVYGFIDLKIVNQKEKIVNYYEFKTTGLLQTSFIEKAFKQLHTYILLDMLKHKEYKEYEIKLNVLFFDLKENIIHSYRRSLKDFEKDSLPLKDLYDYFKNLNTYLESKKYYLNQFKITDLDNELKEYLPLKQEFMLLKKELELKELKIKNYLTELKKKDKNINFYTYDDALGKVSISTFISKRPDYAKFLKDKNLELDKDYYITNQSWTIRTKLNKEN